MAALRDSRGRFLPKGSMPPGAPVLVDVDDLGLRTLFDRMRAALSGQQIHAAHREAIKLTEDMLLENWQMEGALVAEDPALSGHLVGGRWHPLAESTVALRGSAHPILQRTQLLRDSLPTGRPRPLPALQGFDGL